MMRIHEYLIILSSLMCKVISSIDSVVSETITLTKPTGLPYV